MPPWSPVAIDHAAAAQLHRFATITLRSPEATLGEGQYLYEETETRSLVVFVSSATGMIFRYFITSKEERWLGLDGSGRTHSVISFPDFVSDADREAYERYVASPLSQGEWGGGWESKESRSRVGPGAWQVFDFSELPTDVDALREMIERREIIGGPEGDWETFNLAADVLTWGYAPAPLRAAVFEVMAGIPGVELLGRSTDELGRAGISVGYTHNDERQEVLFDRHTAEVLERRHVSVSGDWGPDERAMSASRYRIAARVRC